MQIIININKNEKLEVACRCMDGTSVVGYCFRGIYGHVYEFNKIETTNLIKMNMVLNLSLLASKDSKNGYSIRGKGIDINSLPVYDINTSKFRD